MSQQYQVGKTATVVHKNQNTNMMNVIYHDTIVVAWDDTKIILNTGGWRTATTKTRMNQASNQYQLGYNVYQKDWSWFISFKNSDKILSFDNDEISFLRI